MHYFLLKIGTDLPIGHAVITCLVALPVENALPPRFASNSPQKQIRGGIHCHANLTNRWQSLYRIPPAYS